MKKKLINVSIALALGAITLNSCIGSFGLFNSVLSWNKGLSSNKFVNELVFVLISPAYAVCGVADLLVLNSIEFWTGEKIIAKVGETKEIMGKDGRMYAVKTLKNGYEIKDADGNKSRLIYNKKDKSWSYENNDTIQKLFNFNEDGTIQAYLPNGKTMNIQANEVGLYQVQMAMNDGFYYAMAK